MNSHDAQDTVPLPNDRVLPPPPAQPTVGLPPGYTMYPPQYMPQGQPQPHPHLPPGYMPVYGYPPGFGYPPVGYGYPPGYPLPPGYSYEMPPPPHPMAGQMMPPVMLQPPPIVAEEAIPVAALVMPDPAPPAAVIASTPPASAALVPADPPVTEPVIQPLPKPVAERRYTAPADAPVRRGRFVTLWQKIGGGSLTFSVALHAGLLLLAGLVVFTSTMTAKNVDFLPGGGTQQGAAASQELAHKVQQKRRNNLSKITPKQRLVSQSLTAAITLPEVPLDTLEMPSLGSMMSAGRMSSGGFGSMGSGNGFGTGIGMGSAKGFVGMTLFGKIGGDGLPGVFYDLKQTPDRTATAFAGEISEAEYAGIINKTAAKKFSEKMTSDFFHSTQKMSFTYLLIPYMAATEGPKSFRVEHEVQPRGWFVHYGGQIQPPTPGDYRFVGMFDDALIVYINGKPVLDGSWYSIVDHGERRRDESIRQDFGGPFLPGTGNRKAYAGKWVRIEGNTRIDIVVGERPGGRVGGLLMVQAKKGKYQTRSDGSPILPVFSTIAMDTADQNRLRDFSGPGNAYEIAAETPVFTLKKPLFEDNPARTTSAASPTK